MAITPIDIKDITTGTISGTGIFDKLMQVAMLHLQVEYSSGRITGDTYAQAYIEIMNNVLNQAIQFGVASKTSNAQIEVSNANLCLVEQKCKTEQAQISDTVDGQPVKGTVGKQKAVYSAQAKGFKDDAMSKVLKMMIDVFSVQRGTDEAFAPPTTLANTEIAKMVTETLAQVKQNPPV